VERNMLMLTRKLGERIIIGDDIQISVIEFQGHKVKLGIEAPLKLSVHRAEIAAKIIAENRKASTANQIDRAAIRKLWQQKT
jgi:carbon storage regulator